MRIRKELLGEDSPQALGLVARWEGVKARFNGNERKFETVGSPEALQSAFVEELKRFDDDAMVERYDTSVLVRIGDCRFTVMVLGKSVVVEGVRLGRRTECVEESGKIAREALLRFRRTCVEPLVYGLPIPHLCELSIDLVDQIVEYCISVRDLANLEVTCKFLNAACAPSWHRIADGLNLRGDSDPKILVKNYHVRLRSTRRGFVIPRGDRGGPLGGFPYGVVGNGPFLGGIGGWSDKEPGGGLIMRGTYRL